MTEENNLDDLNDDLDDLSVVPRREVDISNFDDLLKEFNYQYNDAINGNSFTSKSAIDFLKLGRDIITTKWDKTVQVDEGGKPNYVDYTTMSDEDFERDKQFAHEIAQAAIPDKLGAGHE